MIARHNIIKMQLPDGREVSIIQNGEGREGGAYGHADQHMCEVSIEGEPDVKGFLDLSEMVEYLRYLDTTDTLSGPIDASKYEVENYDDE
tara:strand:+ start:1044 stop:1313 length:270 start_codon:yes stop_codon:yes gene_type:complete